MVEEPRAACLLSFAAGLSRKERSCTRLEKDMVSVMVERKMFDLAVF
jgi:hypothetical protein